MIFNETTILDEVFAATFDSLRRNQGSIEFQQANGQWKSLISHYNATFFANIFVQNNFEEHDTYFLYGVGDGQIILELIEQNVQGQVYILETNMDILRFANDSFQVLEKARGVESITLCGSNNIETIKAFLKTLPEKITVRYYYPEISSIPDELSFLSDWLNNRMIDLNSGEKFNELVERNVTFNYEKNLPDFLRVCKGQFPLKPVLILLSGPSLLDSVDVVKAVADQYMIISVGRNGKFCKDNGIRPDLWVDMDPQERPELWERFRENDTTVPLIIMDSASHMVHDYFKGKIAMVRSKTDPNDEYALPTGKSTVAAFALELALEMGMGPAVLVGQDLCYIDDKSHADGVGSAHFTENTPKVICNDGIERYSSKEFIRHRASVQEVVERHSPVTVYSLSAKGAQIEGVKFLPVDDLPVMGIKNLLKDDFCERVQELWYE